MIHLGDITKIHGDEIEPVEEDVPDYYIEYDAEGNETCKLLCGYHKETAYYYTDTQGKRRKVNDGARYKALGNSIGCGPASFWQFLIKRISAEYSRPATLGSLFDGIGGFPMCWENVNGRGSARWASEIEEFPIAVTKQHFPETPDGKIHFFHEGMDNW